MQSSPEKVHGSPLATAEKVAAWALLALVAVLVVLSLVAAALGVVWAR